MKMILSVKQKKIFFFHNHLKYLAVICIVLLQSCKNDNHPKTTNIQAGSSIGSPTQDELNELYSQYGAFPATAEGNKIKSYAYQMQFYRHRKDYQKGMFYVDSILTVTEDKMNEDVYAVLNAKFLFFKGDIYLDLKNYDECFHYYMLGKETVINKIKDKCELSGYSGRIANLFYAQGKFRIAAGYFFEGYHEEKNCQKDSILKFVYPQANLDNVGVCYLKARMYDSADFYFNAALDFIAKNEQAFKGKQSTVEWAKAVVYGNKAEVLENRGKLDSAEFLFLKSIAVADTTDMHYALSTKLALGDMYVANNQMQKAKNMLGNLQFVVDSLHEEKYSRHFYKLNAAYYSKIKNKELAYAFLEKYLASKDSAEARDRQFTALDVGREFENREQKAINETLRKDNELKTVYLLIAVVTSALALIIILLVWYNLKRSGKYVKQLTVLNSEVNQKNEDLQKTLGSLEQSHHENTRIMRIVAHDLKNPISAIHNLVYSLLKKEQQGSVKEVLELIKTACVNSISLIKDLLNEKKQLADVRKELVDMAKLLEYCVELLQAKADEKNQLIELQADSAMIMLNRQKMWRVISNIVNNAIKFSPENTVINIKLQKKESTVLLSVKDNGIGISGELKDKIFTLTPESSRPGTAGEESYGLGLSISQKIIEEHDGKIWFESTKGEGSVFYVELPSPN